MGCVIFVTSFPDLQRRYPSADGSGQYGYGTQNTDGLRKFYRDFILIQVRTYTGVDPSIWRIPPRLFG